MWSKCSHGRENFQKLILTLTVRIVDHYRYHVNETVDMVSIMINKHEYKSSVKDIMDKYYEMFRGKNRGNKSEFFNSPEDVEDSDTDG